MDADLSHNPADLERLTGPVTAGEADLVIGSRYISGVRIMNWPLSRLILSFSAGIYTRAITRIKIQDVTAGFKCFHRRVLEAIDLDRVRSNGYSFQIEMNFIAWKKGFKILEIPIVFTERTEGRSKMSKAIVREAAWKVWDLRIRSIFRRL
jgi:dolichol-phosphate mannosyltransferase